jgi:hypothetical protein
MHLVSTWRGRGAFAAIIAAATIGLLLILASAPATEAQASPRSAAIKQFTLSGAEEVPPVTANATGAFSGTLFENSLEFDLSAVAPSITQAHIHLGAKGTNGPVVAFLFGPADPTVNAIHPTGTIRVTNLVGPLANNWAGFADALSKGQLYVNVHNTENPAGVVRGQIPATSLPAAPRPPATGDSLSTAGDSELLQFLGAAVVTASLVTLTFAVSRRRA